ncbi:MAG: DUF262 domain-containing protein [Cyanobacteriota bacterium]|nr:DUF262 domain-containing protein [Cyanobacteriota bacterium]
MEESEVRAEDNVLENNVEDNSEDILPFQYSITSYGADYPVDGLVKRISNGSIYVPSFQRGYVWKFKEASRFVESLLLGLPVPGIFLAKEQETQKLIVIDGQQRLRTIQYFYDGVFEPTKKEFSLQGISSEFKGKTYKTLSEEDRRRLDDSIIPATIVKQDEPSDDASSIYHIFERLNTGGVNLLPQEIRACIYHGEFNQLLGKLNTNEFWRKVYGSEHPDPRMKDQELILRFLALYFNGENYKKPMKGFLNSFMGRNRHLDRYTNEEIEKVFYGTIETVYKCFGKKAFKPNIQLNAAVFDSIMIGLSYRLSSGLISDEESVKSKYQALLEDKRFLEVTVNTARTTERSIVESRLNQAIDAFRDVE